MKKLFPILIMVVMILSACGAGENAEPTAIPLPTAQPTATAVTMNDPAQSSSAAEQGDERINSVDGMPQVFIPDGSFRRGGLDAQAQADEEPDQQVSMTGFWMDKIEVTNAMYLLCVQAGACEPPKSFASATRDQYFNTSAYNDYPVVNITWGDANNYCEWAGRRLPTEAEWEYAARGTDFRTWPWGEERPDGSRTNFNRLVKDTAPVGQYPAGASPFGVLDLSGNVWEWVSDYYNQNHYQLAGNQDPRGPGGPVSNKFLRVIRGGSWQDVEDELRVSNRGFMSGPNPDATLNSPAYFGDTSNKVGFRCAADN